MLSAFLDIIISPRMALTNSAIDLAIILTAWRGSMDNIDEIKNSAWVARSIFSAYSFIPNIEGSSSSGN
ncbi:hypothetical protein BpHYR1_042284 [Brachionus plicatilis]|uniref:Uncharacterized protein n=1 Tax=Brachionus plicatilis TaxID=10195 RepID=A0A3M7R538_BRAPC|nr:hypothetical protein BpHYR1_042284 [Brachionus plicatilis]